MSILHGKLDASKCFIVTTCDSIWTGIATLKFFEKNHYDIYIYHLDTCLFYNQVSTQKTAKTYATS